MENEQSACTPKISAKAGSEDEVAKEGKGVVQFEQRTGLLEHLRVQGPGHRHSLETFIG